jgi:prefoldin subunit 5
MSIVKTLPNPPSKFAYKQWVQEYPGRHGGLPLRSPVGATPRGRPHHFFFDGGFRSFDLLKNCAIHVIYNHGVNMAKATKQETKELTLNKETIDVLVANIIPTTKYFEVRFDFMQHQIDQTNKNIEQLEDRMNQRFKEVDQRFKQVDQRFEQVDKRFEQINADIRDLKDTVGVLSERIHELTTEVKTSVRDYIIERDRFYDRKFNNLRMFVIALLVGLGGLFLKVIGFFDKVFK